MKWYKGAELMFLFNEKKLLLFFHILDLKNNLNIKLVNDFLNNVRSKFKPAGPVLIKCGFIIENIQQSVSENVLNTHYWSTDVYKTTYFKDYVFHSLKQNILSKVIVNEMSGSSWQFDRFVLINLTVLKLEEVIVR